MDTTETLAVFATQLASGLWAAYFLSKRIDRLKEDLTARLDRFEERLTWRIDRAGRGGVMPRRW